MGRRKPIMLCHMTGFSLFFPCISLVAQALWPETRKVCEKNSHLALFAKQQHAKRSMEKVCEKQKQCCSSMMSLREAADRNPLEKLSERKAKSIPRNITWGGSCPLHSPFLISRGSAMRTLRCLFFLHATEPFSVKSFFDR